MLAVEVSKPSNECTVTRTRKDKAGLWTTSRDRAAGVTTPPAAGLSVRQFDQDIAVAWSGYGTETEQVLSPKFGKMTTKLDGFGVVAVNPFPEPQYDSRPIMERVNRERVAPLGRAAHSHRGGGFPPTLRPLLLKSLGHRRHFPISHGEPATRLSRTLTIAKQSPVPSSVCFARNQRYPTSPDGPPSRESDSGPEVAFRHKFDCRAIARTSTSAPLPTV
jgi:hypothetical protein